VDTFYSQVAGKRACRCFDVNDISGGMMDENMLSVVGGLNVPYVCMHMKGTPQTMKFTGKL
jgi:dihydropteroate synthase